MIAEMEKEWFEALKEEFDKDYYKKLEMLVESEYKEYTVYPPKEDVFSAFSYTPLSKVKVLIIGQDPYHEEHQAHGLSFSVMPGVAIPKSLINIYKELCDDIGCEMPKSGYLEKWARQGVMLLNTVLTVRAHKANSHKNKGWEQFTDAVIKIIDGLERPVVIILWGKPAQSKKKLFLNKRHLILEAPHPSPLSAYRGFFGSKPFTKVNKFLKDNGIAEIDWSL